MSQKPVELKVPMEEPEVDLDAPDLKLTTHRIFPLKTLGSLPRVKINFNFDSEERKLIGKATGMTRE